MSKMFLDGIKNFFIQKDYSYGIVENITNIWLLIMLFLESANIIINFKIINTFNYNILGIILFLIIIRFLVHYRRYNEEFKSKVAESL